MAVTLVCFVWMFILHCISNTLHVVVSGIHFVYIYSELNWFGYHTTNTLGNTDGQGRQPCPTINMAARYYSLADMTTILWWPQICTCLVARYSLVTLTAILLYPPIYPHQFTRHTSASSLSHGITILRSGLNWLAAHKVSMTTVSYCLYHFFCSSILFYTVHVNN